MSIRKAWESRQCSQAEKNIYFYVWTKKVENYVSGVFPNVRGALTFASEPQDVVTAATVAIGVPELGVETSAEIDGQLFVVLSDRWTARRGVVSPHRR